MKNTIKELTEEEFENYLKNYSLLTNQSISEIRMYLESLRNKS
jgi:hypothetical protein